MFEMQGGTVSQDAIFALQDALYSIKNNQCPSSGVIDLWDNITLLK